MTQRALAETLQVSETTLSRVLSGQRNLGKAAALRAHALTSGAVGLEVLLLGVK